MQTKISKMTLKNIKDVHAISIEQFESQSWSLKQFEECLYDKSYICYVLKIDKRVVSFLIAQDLIDSINLLLIATKKEFKNLGIASKLLDLLKNISTEKNIKIWLEVKENNAPAINLYKKFGFTKLYERKNYYKDGKSAIIMEKVNLDK